MAVYAKVPPRFVTGFGSREFDAEGRYLEAHFAGLTVISVYLPSGSSGPHRQASKFRFLEEFLPHLARLRKAGREIVLCGDWNIAHSEIDLKNWRSNQKNSGFLPEERAWLTRVFDELGFVDVFRRIDPRPDQYTWWSNRGEAWAKNVGWRIDYQIATAGIAAKAKAASIYTNRRFSDHAPLMIDYDYDAAVTRHAAPHQPRPCPRREAPARRRELTVHAGHKVGLIGPNGSGKSSLFALILGELHQDAGSVDLPAAWTIAHVAQETEAVRGAGDRVRAGRR